MSTTIVAIIVNLLSVALPYANITIGTEELTTTIQTLVAVVTGLWIWKERVSRGDVNVLGAYKG